MPGAEAPATPLPESTTIFIGRASRHIADDAVVIVGEDVHRCGAAAGRGRRRRLPCAGAGAGSRRRRSRAPAQDHLEAVVVLRVVAAGHLHAARAAVRAARRRDVVEHRRRAPCRGRRRRRRSREAAHEGGTRAPGRETRPSRPTATACSPAASASLPNARPSCSATLVDRLADDAADVVGLEDRSADVHGGPVPRCGRIVGTGRARRCEAAPQVGAAAVDIA